MDLQRRAVNGIMTEKKNRATTDSDSNFMLFHSVMLSYIIMANVLLPSRDRSGTLSEIVGNATFEYDKFFKTLGKEFTTFHSSSTHLL